MSETHPIVIAGAGIAGLSAAYRLQCHGGVPFVLFEKEDHIGGYSRTEQYGAFRFDLGGHRFYTKKAHVEALVRELVQEDLLVVDRLSRILFRGRFVNYPLNALNTLKALGPSGAARAVWDYASMKCRRMLSSEAPEETFEQWALNRFGEYLYRSYFKVYTEKTWGVPCTELSADFAEQRIKGLSFREAVRDALMKKGEDESLVRRFLYPRFGFGQIPRAMAEAVIEPNQIVTKRPVVRVLHDGHRVRAVRTRCSDGTARTWRCSDFISSLPISELVHMMEPAPPEEVLSAASMLHYRDVVILLLAVDVEQVSPDHWIYVPSQEIAFCRLHEPKNWSAEMAPPGRTSLVVEYFCQRGDACWRRGAAQLAAEAAEELGQVGLIDPAWVSDFTTVHLPKAYPIYELGYRAHLETLRRYLEGFDNLCNVGRNASFLYTSSDHYIDMGLKAAENVLGHEHDLHAIGQEQGYAEAWQEDEP